jgi:hypothetical protein
MSRYLPIALGVVAIVALTIVQSVWSDRFADTNVTAEQKEKLLERVPKEFGNWRSIDLEVSEEVQETAGAVGFVSRSYQNTLTGEVVNLWLIVGHARDIGAHTPDICYGGSGFTMRSQNALYSFIYPGQSQSDDAQFWTNTFIKEDFSGRQLVRVFWAWHRPTNDGEVEWQAPGNARWHFGNTRALFKMYFTSVMRDPDETTEDSPCVRFGREFLSHIRQALAESEIGDATGETPAATE